MERFFLEKNGTTLNRTPASSDRPGPREIEGPKVRIVCGATIVALASPKGEEP